MENTSKTRHGQDNILYARKQAAASRRRTLNDILSATRSVPAEVLSYIFQCACPLWNHISDERDYVNRSSKFHLVLRRVSSRWCQVVDSTPQLWTTIRLSRTSLGAQYYLELCLQMSGNLPLYLSLTFWEAGVGLGFGIQDGWDVEDRGCQHGDHSSNVLLAPETSDAFMKNVDRIRYLILHHPPSNWLLLIPRMTLLAACSISDPCRSLLLITAEITLPDSRLTTLCLSRLTIPVHVPCLTITDLNVSNSPIDVCLSILIGCPNLIEFSCSSPTAPTLGPRYTPMKSSVSFECLKALQWELLGLDLSAFNDNFFEHIRTPMLQTLTWSETDGSRWRPAARTFLQRLPTTLETLEFVGVTEFSNRTSDLLYSIPDTLSPVKSIKIISCSHDFISACLSGLSVHEDKGKKVVPFPNLTYLDVDGCLNSYGEFSYNFDADGSESCGYYLFEVLEGRKGLMKEFMLETNCLGVDMDDDIQDALGQMGREGFLVLMDRGERVDWSDFPDW